MLILKIGETELNIKYGYEATIKSGIIRKLAQLEKPSADDENVYEDIEHIMLLLPELILVGAQKFHKDDYGYDYHTNEGKDVQLAKIYNILDEYFDSEDADFNKLFGDLQAELLNNGFLASMFRQEKAKAEQKKNQTTKK